MNIFYRFLEYHVYADGQGCSGIGTLELIRPLTARMRFRPIDVLTSKRLLHHFLSWHSRDTIIGPTLLRLFHLVIESDKLSKH